MNNHIPFLALGLYVSVSVRQAFQRISAIDHGFQRSLAGELHEKRQIRVVLHQAGRGEHGPLGLDSPYNNLIINGSPLRKAQSDGPTTEARIRMSISLLPGDGFASSCGTITSGGPYEIWAMALTGFPSKAFKLITM